MGIDHSDEVGWLSKGTEVRRDRHDPHRLAKLFPIRHANPDEPLWVRAIAQHVDA